MSHSRTAGDLSERVAGARTTRLFPRREVECGCGLWTGARCVWSGPIDRTVVVEYMPEYLRATYEAAGNAGAYPHNGALRVRVERSCAEVLLSVPEDARWACIVESA